MTKILSSPAGRCTDLELRAGTIGALEARAGLPADAVSRFAFWIAFKDHPDPIAAGVAELRARIAALPQSADPDRASPKE